MNNRRVRMYGLIGYPLGHSFSKKFFTEKFKEEDIHDAVYENFPIENINMLSGLIKEKPELQGLNCTIPYKESVMPLLDEIDPEAQAVGAVNTIQIKRYSGKVHLKGYNTDVHGFRESLKPLLTKEHKNALVLGTGGAAKAVVYVLEKMGISYTYVSRSKKGDNCMQYKDVNADVMEQNKLIINTSPVGMYPDTEDAPDLPYECLTGSHYLFDLVYNPEITAFLFFAIQHEAIIKNGLEMLHLQAERAWEVWNGEE